MWKLNLTELRRAEGVTSGEGSLTGNDRSVCRSWEGEWRHLWPGGASAPLYYNRGGIVLQVVGGDFFDTNIKVQTAQCR